MQTVPSELSCRLGRVVGRGLLALVALVPLPAQELSVRATSVPGKTELRLDGGQPQLVAGAVLGTDRGPSPLPSGQLLGVLAPQLFGLAVVDGFGSATMSLQFPAGSLRGMQFYVQGFTCNPALPLTTPLSFARTPVELLQVPAMGAPVDLYLLLGQSNAEGHADSANLPPDLRGPLPPVRIWNVLTNRFEAMQDGVNTRTLSPLQWCGPELTLGTGLAVGGRTVYLLKLAVASSAMGPNPGPFNEWDPTAGELYPVLLQRLAAATAALHADGLLPRVRGIAFMQGETDATSLALATAYEVRLRLFLQRLRTDLQGMGLAGHAAVPAVLGRIDRRLPRSFFPEVRTVRIAQARTALLAGACALVETSELGLRSDGIHFNTDGVRELGTRMAAELLQLPANQSQPIGVLR
jgi:hypothetical protein